MVKSNNIVLILTRNITKINLNFYKKFREIYNINFFFITDKKSKNKEAVFIKDNDCLKYNFKYFTHTTYKQITSWDRGMAFLCHFILDKFDYAWIIEDDVLIKNPRCLYEIIKKYDAIDHDLITNHISKREKNKKWPNWHLLKDHNIKQKYFSFNCICRISNKFVKNLRSYVLKNRNVKSFFHEALFINLCIDKKMKAKRFSPKDKFLIRWRPEIQFNDLKKKYCFYHPVKKLKLKKLFIKY